MDTQAQLQPGMTVYGTDDDKIGKIVAVSSGYIVVEKGFLFPSDHYVPLSAVSSVGDDRVYLTVTKDEALSQGWEEQPADWDTASTTGTANSDALTGSGTPYAETAYGQADPIAATNDVEVTSTSDTSYAAGSNAYATGSEATYDGAGSATEGTEVIAPDYVAADDRAAIGEDAIRVPVYEEDVQAVTRDVERGAIRIEKELVTEERSITVPVTEERVRVTRVSADDPNAVGDDAFREGVIEVPIRGQEVDIEKTARKSGEVMIEKEAETRTEEVGTSIRREEVRVSDETLGADVERNTTR